MIHVALHYLQQESLPAHQQEKMQAEKNAIATKILIIVLDNLYNNSSF